MSPLGASNERDVRAEERSPSPRSLSSSCTTAPRPFPTAFALALSRSNALRAVSGIDTSTRGVVEHFRVAPYATEMALHMCGTSTVFGRENQYETRDRARPDVKVEEMKSHNSESARAFCRCRCWRRRSRPRRPGMPCKSVFRPLRELRTQLDSTRLQKTMSVGHGSHIFELWHRLSTPPKHTRHRRAVCF